MKPSLRSDLYPSATGDQASWTVLEPRFPPRRPVDPAGPAENAPGAFPSGPWKAPTALPTAPTGPTTTILPKKD